MEVDEGRQMYMIISGLSIQDICVITLHIDEDLGRRDIIIATAREVQNDF